MQEHAQIMLNTATNYGILRRQTRAELKLDDSFPSQQPNICNCALHRQVREVAIMIYTNDCIPRRLFSNYTGYILYCASIRRPRQPLNNQNNGSVSFLPLLNHLLCINTFSQLHRQE